MTDSSMVRGKPSWDELNKMYREACSEIDRLTKRLELALPADVDPSKPLAAECECCEGNGFQCDCCGHMGEPMPNGHVLLTGEKAGLIYEQATGQLHTGAELLATIERLREAFDHASETAEDIHTDLVFERDREDDREDLQAVRTNRKELLNG